MTRLTHSYSSIKQYENCPLRYKLQRITKEVKDVPGEASMYGERVHEQLEHRLKEGTPLPIETRGYETLCRVFERMPGTLVAEQEMTLTEQLTPTGWWDKDAWLRSKLDIIVIDNPTAVVVDWKTGKRRPDFFQLELFALQTFKHYPDVECVKSTFVWLKEMKMDSEVYTRADEPKLWATFMAKVKRIEKSLDDDNWPAKPSGLCPWCPAYKTCEYSR